MPPAPIATPAPTAGTAQPTAAPIATIHFDRQSAQITGTGRAQLAQTAKTLKGVNQIEIHAYAGGNDPADDRKLALARALVVRGYLIDLGVTPKMEVANTSLPFSSDGSTEHVDILVASKTSEAANGRAASGPVAQPAVAPQVVERQTTGDPTKALAAAPAPPAIPPATPAPTAGTARPTGTPVATIHFDRQSAQITGTGRAQLAQTAKALKGARQIEIHAYAGGNDPADDRKLALARALVVRSFLIDLGVAPKMEVANTNLPFSSDGSTEHVDILVSTP